jgi:type IV pilus assembly protein PilO
MNLNINLDELRNLDFRQAGQWSWTIKGLLLAVTFITILVFGYLWGWSEQNQRIQALEGEERALRDVYSQKKAQAINLDLYSSQLKDITAQFGTLLKQLPSKSEIEGLLSDVNQAGIGRGLQFDLFRPASQEKLSEFYAEQPVDIKVTGNYHDFGAFASDVAQLPRIVTLGDINIAPGKDNNTLVMDAVARTYRYLDDEEVAKQRKLLDDAKKKAAGK